MLQSPIKHKEFSKKPSMSFASNLFEKIICASPKSPPKSTRMLGSSLWSSPRKGSDYDIDEIKSVKSKYQSFKVEDVPKAINTRSSKHSSEIF